MWSIIQMQTVKRRVWKSMVAMAIMPSRHWWEHGWCVPLTARCAHYESSVIYISSTMGTILYRTVSFTEIHTQAHASGTWPVNTKILLFREDDAERMETFPEVFRWNSDWQRREKAVWGETKRKIKEKQSEDHQIPRVREEANRQRETSNRGGDLFLTAALNSSQSPMTKQAALMSLVLVLTENQSGYTTSTTLLKQGQEKTNRREKRD